MKCRIFLALTGSLLLIATAPVSAAEHAHPAPASAARSTLQGAAPVHKFVTDAALRQGMTTIAAVVGQPAAAIEAGTLKGPAYLDMATQIDGQVAYIFKNCKLEPKADHMLHDILHDVSEAVVLMRRSSVPIQRTGVIALNQALRNYAKYFDHPGWTGPQPQ